MATDYRIDIYRRDATPNFESQQIASFKRIEDAALKAARASDGMGGGGTGGAGGAAATTSAAAVEKVTRARVDSAEKIAKAYVKGVVDEQKAIEATAAFREKTHAQALKWAEAQQAAARKT